ncbi:MAG: bifunctional folylpolyglutamate synthase/dihydrofolate synthase [Nitrospiria bacterium]
MNYHETLQFLYQLQIKGMKFGLSSMHKLLAVIHNPHLYLKTVHVGGTNGKGSTSAMIASVLRHAGYKVGLYTSPHLIDFSERITVNSIPIPQIDVIRLTKFIHESHVNQLPETPTFFEWTTAMAFLYFLEQKVDIAVIEVGLGGRLDSTNVITPLVSLITNIDFDHQEYLGKTLLEIGREKAGIIKQGVPLISGTFPREVQEMIQKTTTSLDAPFYQRDIDFSFHALESGDVFSNSFDYTGVRTRWQNLSITLLGEHQKNNASLALMTLELLEENGFSLSEDDVRRGLANVCWPGRIEIIKKTPLTIFDGAHNPSGASILVSFLNRISRKGKRLLVLGIMKDKDIRGIGEYLLPWADEIILTKASFPRAASPDELQKALPTTSKPVHLIESISEVIPFLENHANFTDTICFTGSLYTIGEAKALLEGVSIDVPLHG